MVESAIVDQLCGGGDKGIGMKSLVPFRVCEERTKCPTSPFIRYIDVRSYTWQMVRQDAAKRIYIVDWEVLPDSTFTPIIESIEESS